jgi:hypothetical protein
MFGADRRGSFADARSGECRDPRRAGGEESLIKYARDEGAGAANWNPALHPRTGAPPNPGWFAPTSGASHDAPRVRVAENDGPTRQSDASPDAVNVEQRYLIIANTPKGTGSRTSRTRSNFQQEQRSMMSSIA